jgi:uracil-DNA glycosylase
MSSINPAIDDSWKAALTEEFEKPYFARLKEFLISEKKQYTVYPPGPLIFNAFNTTPFNEVRVVLIGQDPYHGHGQAHGLSFSVPDGVRPPPSLVNIFKELHNDVDIPIPRTGNLTKWAKQGVLLLNATLTVRAGQPASHQDQGWETFTNAVICMLSEKKEGLVFLLWGKFAQAKENLIDTTKHFILKAAHPSPYSASSGFFGCGHFSRTNRILKEQGLKEIDWRVE